MVPAESASADLRAVVKDIIDSYTGPLASDEIPCKPSITVSEDLVYKTTDDEEIPPPDPMMAPNKEGLQGLVK